MASVPWCETLGNIAGQKWIQSEQEGALSKGLGQKWNGLANHQHFAGEGWECPLFNIKDLNPSKGSNVAPASFQTTTDHLQNAQLRAQTASPEVATPNTATNHLQIAQLRAQTASPEAVSPNLMRCIIISWSEKRAEFLRTAAESESWETLVCSDAMKFMRSIFRLKFPLMIVDLPKSDASDYDDLRNATERSRAVSNSLLVVSVLGESPEDEIWSRQLGAWAHLPGTSNSVGLEMVFREARQAIARQEPAYGVLGEAGTNIN